MAHVIPGSRNSHPLSRMGMFLVTWMEQQEMRGRVSDLYQLELYNHACMCVFLLAYHKFPSSPVGSQGLL